MNTKNLTLLTGRIASEIRYSQTGKDVEHVFFMLAVSRNFKNKQNQYDTDFIPIHAWRSMARTMHDYYTKGQLVQVAGTLMSQQSERDGKKQTDLSLLLDNISPIESKQMAQTRNEAKQLQGNNNQNNGDVLHEKFDQVYGVYDGFDEHGGAV